MTQTNTRIKEIYDLSNNSYDTVYDLCCDHGKIGIQYLSKNTKVIFVDIIKTITDALTRKMEDSDITHNYEIKTQDMLLLQESSENCLYVLAGVGDDLMIKMCQKLFKFNNEEIDILICSHGQAFKIRNYLMTSSYSLLNEKLISEKNQFYELIYITKRIKNSPKCTMVGTKMWQNTDKKVLLEYVNKQLDYLHIKLRNHKSNYFSDLFDKYTELKINLS